MVVSHFVHYACNISPSYMHKLCELTHWCRLGLLGRACATEPTATEPTACTVFPLFDYVRGPTICHLCQGAQIFSPPRGGRRRTEHTGLAALPAFATCYNIATCHNIAFAWPRCPIPTDLRQHSHWENRGACCRSPPGPAYFKRNGAYQCTVPHSVTVTVTSCLAVQGACLLRACLESMYMRMHAANATCCMPVACPV